MEERNSGPSGADHTTDDRAVAALEVGKAHVDRMTGKETKAEQERD